MSGGNAFTTVTPTFKLVVLRASGRSQPAVAQMLIRQRKVPTNVTAVAERTFSGFMFTEMTGPFPGQDLLDGAAELQPASRSLRGD